MKIFTKKRVVLFLLFIFPLICFILLSTGENNFKKLPVVTENILDIKDLKSNTQVTLKDHVSVICFLGENIEQNKTAILNLNEKIYKKFLDYKNFQVIAIYPEDKKMQADKLRKDISAFTDMIKWKFISMDTISIEGFFDSFQTPLQLTNTSSSKAFIIDKDVNLRGRLKDPEIKDGKLYGYNMNSIAELNSKMKDDISVLFYEYYAAFKIKNKNKADRKEVGL